MADVKKLDLNLESIDWENTGSYIDTTNEGILIRDNEGSHHILAIKKIEKEKDRKKYLEICKQVALDYCFKVVGKDKLSFKSELYEREILIQPMRDSLNVNNLVIGRVYYKPSHIESIKRMEKDDIWLRPFGYECFKLWKKKDPTYIFKLREYTRKLLGNTYYRDSDIKKGLFSDSLGDTPEDVFMTKLTEILASGFVHIRNLDNLPHKIKNYLEYHYPKNQSPKKFIPYVEESRENHSSSEESYSEEYHQISKNLKLEYKETEDLMLDSLIIKQIQDVANKVLTTKENRVLKLCLNGLTITEIARKTGVTKQSVSEMKKRAENKIRENLKLEI